MVQVAAPVPGFSSDPVLAPVPALSPVPVPVPGVQYFSNLFSFIMLTTCTGMDVDADVVPGAGAPADPGSSAAAAAESLRNAIASQDQTGPRPPSHQLPATPSSVADTAKNEQVINSLSPGNLINQWSNAKKAKRVIDVQSCTGTNNGPEFNTAKAAIPRIGSMFKKGDYLNTLFHGARLMKNGSQTNEVITMSFDPSTLTCLCCKTPHCIIDKNGPTAICFTDQNFVHSVPSSTGSGCLAVVRVEDASLHNLAEIAIEILDKCSLHPGSVFMIGSVSHLFKEGTSTYAADWVRIAGMLSQKFKNTNICPLVPVIKEDCPGALARDIETLALWLQNCYNTSIKGLLDSWKAVTNYAKANSSGSVPLLCPDLSKIPLPKNLQNSGTETNFRFDSSCPVHLAKMDRQTVHELVQILVNILQRDFAIPISPEVILSRTPPSAENLKDIRTIVCIGSSIIKYTVPFLQAQGFKVIDLSVPGWLATDENIAALQVSMSKLQVEPGIAVVFDLLSNCSIRYVQFDDTQALAQKDSGRYHMKGQIATCNEEIFVRILKSISPVLLSAQSEIKISLPPLPRYIFHSCCTNPTHCTNLLEEGHTEKILNGVTGLRHVMKKHCAEIGVKNHWILDGVGAVTGPTACSCRICKT
jgi:hypothetical protein